MTKETVISCLRLSPELQNTKEVIEIGVITYRIQKTPVETGVKPKLTAFEKDCCGNEKKCNLFTPLKKFCRLVDNFAEI